MRRGRHPTRKQKALMQHYGLWGKEFIGPCTWLVYRDLPDKLIVIHRYTGHVREIPKRSEAYDAYKSSLDTDFYNRFYSSWNQKDVSGNYV